jgi:flagellar hook protein FlgE
MSNQVGLDVISDNLTNISTTAFKGTTTEFSDLFSKVMSSGNTPTSNDIGYGSKIQATTTNMTQGSLMPSDRYTDLALEGNGWFGVVANNKTSYTRDGSFSFDTSQKVTGDVNSSITRLVTGDGMYVTGTMQTNISYDPAFNYTGSTTNGASGAYVISKPTSDVPLTSVSSQTPLDLPTLLAYPVEPTTKLQFMGNLGTDNTIRSINGSAINAKNETNRVNLTFTKSATQPAIGTAWDIVATATSKDGTIVYDTQKGQATFDATGAISNFTIPSLNNNGSPVSVDLGSGFGGVISAQGIAISGASQGNGYPGGTLTKYGIDTNGVIVADFTNGRQSAVGRIAVYHFRNDPGLDRNGGTYYTQSSNSGKPLFWKDSNGNAITGASVRSGHLEASNVRTEVGLTDMIVTQRAYQANAKTITTVDDMIQKALQMHR